MPQQTRPLSKRQREEMLAKPNEAQIQELGNCVQERQELFTLTLDSENLTIEFQHIDSYRVATVEHELIQLCQNLRIIERNIEVTKEETI